MKKKRRVESELSLQAVPSHTHLVENGPNRPENGHRQATSSADKNPQGKSGRSQTRGDCLDRCVHRPPVAPVAQDLSTMLAQTRKTGIKTYESSTERSARSQLVTYLKKCPIPDGQLLSNLGLFLNSKNLSRLLFMDHLYRQIIEIQGVIMEFGTRWGQNLALFSALRGIYEPFNRHRKIVGFDTFKGFPSVSKKDGSSDMMEIGNLAVTKDYVGYLTKVLEYHEQDNPLSHIKKFELKVGDATVEIDKYLGKHPETIIALAYFDFDLYEPTRKCLEAIKHRLVKGSVLGFDELNDPDSPGETLALKEVFGLTNIKLKRYRYTSRVSYFVLE